MARGWESKAVADQIEEGKSRRPEAAPDDLSTEGRQRQEQLQSLRLSRTRMLQQLEHATHPSHRMILQNGLRAIEAEIERVLSDS